MQEQQRSYLLGVRITPQEKAELERLAKQNGSTLSSTARLAITRLIEEQKKLRS